MTFTVIVGSVDCGLVEKCFEELGLVMTTNVSIRSDENANEGSATVTVINEIA